MALPLVAVPLAGEVRVWCGWVAQKVSNSTVRVLVRVV